MKLSDAWIMEGEREELKLGLNAAELARWKWKLTGEEAERDASFQNMKAGSRSKP